MSQSVIADTGFLVALLSQNDCYHSWAKQQANVLPLGIRKAWLERKNRQKKLPHAHKPFLCDRSEPLNIFTTGDR